MQETSVATGLERDPSLALASIKLPKLSGVSLVSYPYAPILSSRGIDRYGFYLYKSLQEVAVPTRIVGPGIRPSVRALALNDPQVLWRVIRDKSPLLHAISPVGGRIAALAGKSPLITTIHDVIPFFLRSYSPMKYTFLRQCIRISAKSSDGIIVPFEFTKRFLVKKFSLDPDKLSVVSYGVDLSGFHPMTHREESGKRVLFLGGSFPMLRGGDIVLRAFSRASHTLPDIHLIMGGGGPEQGMLRSLAKNLGLADRVSFPGFIEESNLRLLMRSMDLVVHPSRLGFSLSVLQAMASKVPVLVTDDLDLQEAVEDAGLVCPSGDVDAVAKSMIQILTEDDFATMIALKGFERSRHFSTDQMTMNTFKVYEQVVARTRS